MFGDMWNYVDENGVFHSGDSIDEWWDAASEGKGTLLATPKNKALSHWNWKKCVAEIRGDAEGLAEAEAKIAEIK